jgi:hypothetical protein
MVRISHRVFICEIREIRGLYLFHSLPSDAGKACAGLSLDTWATIFDQAGPWDFR